MRPSLRDWKGIGLFPQGEGVGLWSLWGRKNEPRILEAGILAVGRGENVLSRDQPFFPVRREKTTAGL